MLYMAALFGKSNFGLIRQILNSIPSLRTKINYGRGLLHTLVSNNLSLIPDTLNVPE